MPVRPPPPEEAPPPRRERKQGTRTRKTSLEKLDPTGRGIVPVLDAESALLPNGGGRSRRQRFRPLDFWRGERVVYGRRDSAKFEAIVDVEVKPRTPTPPRRRAAAAKRKAATEGAVVPFEDEGEAQLALEAPAGGEGAAHGSAADPLANAVDALASSDEEEARPIQPPGGRRVKKKARKAAAHE